MICRQRLFPPAGASTTPPLFSLPLFYSFFFSYVLPLPLMWLCVNQFIEGYVSISKSHLNQPHLRLYFLLLIPDEGSRHLLPKSVTTYHLQPSLQQALYNCKVLQQSMLQM